MKIFILLLVGAFPYLAQSMDVKKLIGIQKIYPAFLEYCFSMSSRDYLDKLNSEEKQEEHVRERELRYGSVHSGSLCRLGDTSIYYKAESAYVCRYSLFKKSEDGTFKRLYIKNELGIGRPFKFKHLPSGKIIPDIDCSDGPQITMTPFELESNIYSFFDDVD